MKHNEPKKVTGKPRRRPSLPKAPTGIPRLDAMMGGKGDDRGSSVPASGAAGTGKTSLAAYLAQGAAARGAVASLRWSAFSERAFDVSITATAPRLENPVHQANCRP